MDKPLPATLTARSPESDVEAMVENSIRTKLYFACYEERARHHRLLSLTLRDRKVTVEWECQDYTDRLLQAIHIPAERKKHLADQHLAKLAQIDVVYILETFGRDFRKLYGFPSPVDQIEVRGTFRATWVVRALFGREAIDAAACEIEGDASFTEGVFGAARACELLPPFNVSTVGLDQTPMV